MADDRDDNQCGHEMCTCPVATGAEYCSPHCRGAGESDMTAIACECGHAGCAAEVTAQAPGL